ncbi:MAG: hypothetical protein C4576_22760 [Desulfobacteraceae bacterium]|nr:MAG: hypothetical protein C4576_22760 [Desulfobacteraceae bacterium]
MEDSLMISLPSFLIESVPPERIHPENVFAELDGSFYRISTTDYRPEPFHFEKDNHRIVLLGTPVYEGKIEKRKLCGDFLNHHESPEWLREINGEFLFIHADPEKKELSITNNRFTSPPFYYYARNGRFVGSFSYGDLWRRLHRLGLLEIREEGFFELLLFKRIFGEKTHDRTSLFLKPGSILRWNGKGVTIESYWRPDFRAKSCLSLQEYAHSLQEGIADSILRRTSDGKRYGLFLSGGMDTRVILASFRKVGILPVCFTVNSFENREVKIARQVAAIAGAEHVFLPFKKRHYLRTFPHALRITGAMQLPMCMFLGFEKEVSSHADVAFHGHGFDYFFQGMYIPALHPEVLGHRLEYRRMRTVPADICRFFLNTVSYRTKGGDALEFVKPGERERLQQGLETEIERIKKDAESFCEDPYDIFEYLTFHNLSRHYTYGDHWSINTNAEQRTLSFDNALYDLYQTLRASDRFDGRIQRTCLMNLDPRLGRLLSANNAYPMYADSLLRTYYQIRNALLMRLGILDSKFYRDDGFQRMGLPLDYVLRTDFRPMIDELLESERLSAIPFIDMDSVVRRVKGWMETDRGGDQVLYSLMTIDQFLKQLEQSD